MCVHGSLIVLLSVAGAVAFGLALAAPPRDTTSVEIELQRREPLVAIEGAVGATDTHRTAVASGRTRTRRRTRDQEDQSNIESSVTLWEWLKGRDKPENNCMLMAIGGVASGGFLTGAFVGAGIGSIFTGPGAIVGGIVGGLVGVFGGLSVAARAGAAACENV